ncbi:MAG TPA: LysR family transcriptional regulator [Alphaproteobacteria bacterium]|nr:LysR family transcriptional regulator [Alphaproteobacteria bacterium]
MDLRHLRYFVAVAESGTVSKAADKVRISQPALSRQIHDLESELGVALFERAGRRLHLTGAGEDLLAHGRKVLNEAEAFRERARVLHRGDTGVLHVGATPHSLQRLFPAVLNRFRRVLPGVDIRLTEGHSAMLLDLIRTGTLHLAFTTYQPELRKASRLVGVVPLLAISHSERRGQWNTIEVRALEDIPLLLLQRGFGTRELFEAACHVAHIRPNIFLESDAPATLLSLAKAGCGIAILPATVRLQGSGLTIQKIVQDGVPLEFRVAVHWDPQRFLPPYAERFAEELSAYAAKEYATVAVSDEKRNKTSLR